MATDPQKGTDDFASMLAEYERQSGTGSKKAGGRQIGDTVRARVISISAEAVFVDLGSKADGVLDLAEFRDEEGRLGVTVGDTVEARIVDTGERDGTVRLRRFLGRGPDARAELEQAFAHGVPVEGLVTGVNKGGVEVRVGGVRAFCPISQLDLRHVADAAPFVGQRLTFRITRFEDAPLGRAPNLVLSRRSLLEEEAGKKAAETRKTLEVGAVVHGTVTTIKDYGAFIDIGGLEGMLHVSQIGFQRISHPKDALSVGQPVEVQIIKIERSDDPERRERISLSLRSLERDPWQDAAQRLPEGMRLSGKVARLETFGAFIELALGIEGLIHVSELAGDRRIAHPREVVQVGQSIEVSVLGVDVEKRRVSLGLASGDDDTDAEAIAAVRSGGGATLGTLGDLLRGPKSGERRAK